MAKSFWEYLTTSNECETHKYFVERFTECVNKVDKMNLHSCDNMHQILESLAERFHYQELWISKLHKRIEELEKGIHENNHRYTR